MRLVFCIGGDWGAGHFMMDILHQWLRVTGNKTTLGVSGAVTFFFILTGPFGTFTAMDFGLRVYYWITLMAVIVLFATLVRSVLMVSLPRLGLWTEGVLVAGVQAIGLAPFVNWFSNSVYLSEAIRLPSVPGIMAYIFVISGMASVIRHLIANEISARRSSQAARPQPRSEPEPEPQPAEPRSADLPKPFIYRRLPDDHGGALVRLSAQDHFVEIATTEDVFRVRMRLSDAIDETSGVLGHSTHRSHWVAHSAISKVLRENGREVLVLVDGSQVPVGRKYRPELVDAGLI